MVPAGCYAPRKCAGGIPMGHPPVPESPRVAEAAEPAEDYDVSQRQDVAKLRRGAVVLGVFSVGYVAMARKKTTAGGFYSYISHGLGRELGIGTGYASVVAYSVFEASLAGGFAYFLSLKLNQFGVSSAWPWL